MISFFLFETHRRIIFLEALKPDEAAGIFKKLGASDDDLKTKANRRAFFKKQIRFYHPDINKGDKAKEEIFKNLSSANDTLEKLPDNYFDKKDLDSECSLWQTDPRGSCHISREDCTDVNYFKKKIWELSKDFEKKRIKYTIMAYDGYFFRHMVTVFGSDATFFEMAKSMIVFNSHGGNPYNTEAVFVMKETSPHKLFLIYLKPHFLLAKNTIVFDEEDFQGMPYNDQRFMRVLPDRLREISHELNESIKQPMTIAKATINGNIDRKKSDAILDPKGYFAKNKRKLRK